MYLKKMAEEVIRRYEGGDPSSDSSLDPREVQLLIVQEINRRLKLEQMNIHIPMGEYVPPHAAIATYNLTPTNTGYTTTEFTRTRLSQPFPGQYWSHPNGQFWTDSNGDYFVVDESDAVLTITSNGGTSYTITISGATEPTGLEWSDVVSFITFSATEVGYFKFYGMVDSDRDPFTVLDFDWAGVSGLTATADGFTFDYDLADTVNSADAIHTAVLTDHANIASVTGTNNVGLVSMEKYVLTTNVESEAKATATLPAQPINLPRGMGVWMIYSESAPHMPFIPIPSGQHFLIDGVATSSLALLNTYTYFNNKTIFFNKKVADLPTDLKIQLLIVDPEQLSETELLPIPADMEMEVIITVLELLNGVQTPEDNRTNQNPNIR